MTCKDCIHNKVCSTYVQVGDDGNACPRFDIKPVKHGKWIKELGINEKCSVCGGYFPLSDFVGRPFDINYCPNCGAKMDFEE